MKIKKSRELISIVRHNKDEEFEYESKLQSSKKSLHTKIDSSFSHFNMYSIEHKRNLQQNTHETQHKNDYSVRNNVDNTNREHDFELQRRLVTWKTTNEFQSKHKLTNHMIEQELNTDNELYISSNNLTNIILKQKIEQQQSKKETKTSHVISNVANNILDRKNKQTNSCTRTKDSSKYTLKNTVGTVQMKFSFKITCNNIDSKNTTSYTPRNNVDNIMPKQKWTKEKEETSLNQINNDNTKLEETSTFKQTAISTLTTANDEVSSTLLPLREENDISALKYKDQLHNVTKEHEKGPKRILNEQQIPFYSTIDQLTKDLEQKMTNLLQL